MAQVSRWKRPVDRRIYQRHPADIQVRVTALEDPNFTASGQVVEMSQSGIGVYLPLQFEPGSVVRLSMDDGVLYGFVAHSAPERSYFRTGIEIVQVLTGGAELPGQLNPMRQEPTPDLELVESHR